MRRRRLVFSVALFLAVLTPSDRTVPLATATPTTKNDPRQSLAIVVNPSNPIENLSLSNCARYSWESRFAGPTAIA